MSSNCSIKCAHIFPIDREENTPIVRKSKDAELRAIRKAEEQKFDEALDLINEAIETAPDRASPYNNKAQICQLMGKAQGT